MAKPYYPLGINAPPTDCMDFVKYLQVQVRDRLLSHTDDPVPIDPSIQTIKETAQMVTGDSYDETEEPVYIPLSTKPRMRELVFSKVPLQAPG